VVVKPAPSALPLPALAVIPRHVAVIMDGNGRWAKARGLSRSEGHRAGAEAIRPVIERLAEHKVPILTLFGFSTENWGRPSTEVETILKLGSEFIDSYLDELDANGVSVRHLGDASRLPLPLRRRVKRAVERTARNDRMVVNLAFNYGGRADIVRAVQDLVRDGAQPEEITEDAITARLATGTLPDVDLLVRTGGERRISNFVVWQATYAEYYFTDVLWPDFDALEVDAALQEFARRQRRFGLVPTDPPRDTGART
jgi:undecaprenyl diphosphate synthase